jgi:arylsulfatase A-like enzyme
LPDEVVTLAEVMRAAGYRTAAVVSNIHMSPLFNLNQGFDEYYYLGPDYFFYATESSSNLVSYNILRLVRERFFSRAKDHRYYYRDAAEVNEAAVARLADEKSRPFFLYLHYMDPHDPYFVHPYNGEAVARVHTPRPDPGQAERLMRLYDGEVSYLDDHLGRLIELLKRQGVYDSSLIVLTSDHGEEFYEHGGWWHGVTLYEEQIHVPLIVKLPRQKRRGERVEGLARSIDVAPTILGAVGAEVPRVMQGRDLLGPGAEEGGVEYVYAEEDFEGNVLKTIRGREWKLILADAPNPRGLKAVELYRLSTDPRELEDRSSVHRDRVDALVPELTRLAEGARKGSVVARQRKIDQAAKERLRMLGY